jgi:hypothetical protein
MQRIDAMSSTLRRVRKNNANFVKYRPSIEFLESRELLASDFGDAPIPYWTLLAENGAQHVAAGPTLGTSRDTEADGVHTVGAVGDDITGIDDETGVTFGPMRVGQLRAVAVVNVTSGSAFLDAWIDFNRDGSFGGPMEQIANNVARPAGKSTIEFDVPSWALDGATYARFRVSTVGNLGIGGQASDGEVEDYAVTIKPPTPTVGQFGSQNIISFADQPRSVYASDVDRDGDTDVLSASKNDSKIAWYENNGSQTFTPHTISSDALGAYKVTTADIDGDSDTDVLSASYTDHTIAWYENNGSQGFTKKIITTNAVTALDVFAADIDGDGDTDVMSASSSDSKIAWYQNDGNQNFTEKTVTTNALAARSVFAADVDSDGDTDILSASLDSKFTWYENVDNENFTPHTITNSALGANHLIATDLDSDSDTDVLGASYNDDTIAWYENDGNEAFTKHVISTSANFAFRVFAADMDGDGDTDVLSASGLDDKIAWYENDGGENFTPHTISVAADGPEGMFAADIDGDGDIDVLSTSFNDNKIAWYENLGNRLVTNTNDSGPGSLRQAIVETNTNPDPETISFRIGTGVQTVAPTAALPTITNSVTIDGTTQPGFVDKPLIVLSGASIPSANGVTITAGSSTVRSLVVNGFTTGVGIMLQTGGGNVLEGNYIGTNQAGTGAVPNGTGIKVQSSSGNTIGGTVLGRANKIALNTGVGVQVDTGNGNAIRQNSIFGNGGLGIALTNGGNNNQAAPKVTRAISFGSTTKVWLTLTSTPNTTFNIDVFGNAACDQSGFGEGETFLGTTALTTGPTGTGSTTATFAVGVPPGHVITATATSPTSNTSAFSKCMGLMFAVPAVIYPIPPLPPAPLGSEHAEPTASGLELRPDSLIGSMQAREVPFDNGYQRLTRPLLHSKLQPNDAVFRPNLGLSVLD